MDINTKIYKRRKELDLTQDELAKLIGVSKGTIAKWESGFIENMKVDKIQALADVLDLDVRYLISENIEVDEKNDLQDASRKKLHAIIDLVPDDLLPILNTMLESVAKDKPTIQ